MVHWSILSNVVNYVQYDRDPKHLHDLNIKALDWKNHKKMNDKLTEDERKTLDIDFGDNPDKLRGNIETYMKEFNQRYDIYEGVQSEVLNTTRFDESSDSSTT